MNNEYQPTPPERTPHRGLREGERRTPYGISYLYAPGEVLLLQPGCYVDAANYTMAGATDAALDVCWALGAMDSRRYESEKSALRRSALLREAAQGEAAMWQHEIGEGIVEALNKANTDDALVWQWEAGDLLYCNTDDEEAVQA